MQPLVEGSEGKAWRVVRETVPFFDFEEELFAIRSCIHQLQALLNCKERFEKLVPVLLK
jgi:hypothetical protein